MLAAGNIGVSEFVHQDYFGFPPENRIHIHFFEDRTLVFDFLARDGFDLRGQLFDALAAVRLHDTDDHVFAAASAAERFTQHAIGLADARSVAQE